MLKKIFKIYKSFGLKNFVKKGAIYLYRSSGLQGFFSRYYSYDEKLYPRFGELIFDWEKLPFASLTHVNKVSDYLRSLTEESVNKIRTAGNEILNGQYTLFSYHKVYQEHIDFNWDPLENVKWPEKKHSTSFSQFDPNLGDIKRVWELNRFVFADALVPLYILEEKAKNKEAIREKFLSLLESWLLQNPFEKTVAWSCSQEISIRCINLIFIFRYLECQEDNEMGRLFKNLLALSARHVYKEIGYAKTQRNNHAITESAFLIIFSSLFPQSKVYQKYYWKGFNTLSFCLEDQFFSDGTYIQNSFTYQRFALQSILLVESLIKEKIIKKQIKEILAKNLIFLCNISFGKNGNFPNYGPNDGALLFNWSGCDYRDMRPLLNLLSIKTQKNPLFLIPELLIDAAFIIEEFNSQFNETYIPQERKSFDQSGYYIIKNDTFSVLFRCGSYDHRFPSQNDMLHVDVWINGKPVLVDSGTFEYYGTSGLKNFYYFLSTAAHNTIKIGELDQLDKGPRFTWLSSISAKLTDNKKDNTITGESYAYNQRLKGNPVHRRKLTIFSNQLVIEDEIVNTRDYLIELFWHIAGDEEITNENENIFYLDKKQKTKITFYSEALFNVKIIKTPLSQYYAERNERNTFVLTTKGDFKTVKFKTVLHLIS